MSSRVVRERTHRCQLPSPIDGEIRQCEVCGIYWLGRQPGNPAYDAWHRLTWLGRKLRRLP